MEKNDEPKYPYELFGVDCEKGWEKLYQPIIDYIDEYNKKNEEKIEIHQIKEKFGGLRVYLSHYTDELRQMIDKAEEESFNTCEICGRHIKKPIVENHWIYPMCRKCFRKGEENKLNKMNESFENSKDKSQEGGKTSD